VCRAYFFQHLADGILQLLFSHNFHHLDSSEVVWWNLADTPVSITPAQYSTLVSLIIGYLDPVTCALGTNAGPAGRTARPIQPLNGRVVDRICPVGFMDGTEDDMDDSGADILSLTAMGAAAMAGAALLL
jgi:hypothetical protein